MGAALALRDPPTDGSNNVIVWVVGAEGDSANSSVSAETPARSFTVAEAQSELMSGTHRWCTAISSRGRIYAASDNRVYAFTVPVPPIVLTNAAVLPGGAFRFGFTNIPGLNFTVRGTTNLALPFTNWALLGNATEISPGQFQFTIAPVDSRQFYRVTTP